MDIEQFVADTLTQVIRGFERAKVGTSDSGAVFNPPFAITDKSAVMGYTTEHPPRAVVAVDFDVAVVATDTNEAGGSAKLSVSIASVKVGAGLASSTEATSRVKFRVPLALPTDLEFVRVSGEKTQARVAAENERARLARENGPGWVG